MAKCMGKGNFNGKMVLAIRESTNMARSKGQVSLHLPLETSIRASG